VIAGASASLMDFGILHGLDLVCRWNGRCRAFGDLMSPRGNGGSEDSDDSVHF
jgi:hypothetical protein